MQAVDWGVAALHGSPATYRAQFRSLEETFIFPPSEPDPFLLKATPMFLHSTWMLKLAGKVASMVSDRRLYLRPLALAWPLAIA